MAGVIELTGRPSRHDLRWFGFIVPVFFAVVGSIAGFRFDAFGTAYVLWGLGAILTVVYVAVRPLRIPFYLGWMRLFFPLGFAVSHLVLILLYYGVVTPIAVMMRLVGYDPLRRKRDRRASTYWVEHRTGGDPSRYLRQF
jgi:hypothetical protein